MFKLNRIMCRQMFSFGSVLVRTVGIASVFPQRTGRLHVLFVFGFRTRRPSGKSWYPWDVHHINENTLRGSVKKNVKLLTWMEIYSWFARIGNMYVNANMCLVYQAISRIGAIRKTISHFVNTTLCVEHIYWVQNMYNNFISE